jgi:hypothetical protein
VSDDFFDDLTGQQRQAFTQWARRATRGVKGSTVFLQLFNAKALTDGQDLAYALQLGAAILLNKPIVIIAPEGSAVPAKLQALATSVQYFIPDDKESMLLATRRALEAADAVEH